MKGSNRPRSSVLPALLGLSLLAAACSSTDTEAPVPPGKRPLGVGVYEE